MGFGPQEPEKDQDPPGYLFLQPERHFVPEVPPRGGEERTAGR